jgi:hypothetical protein
MTSFHAEVDLPFKVLEDTSKFVRQGLGVSFDKVSGSTETLAISRS